MRLETNEIFGPLPTINKFNIVSHDQYSQFADEIVNILKRDKT